MLPGVNKDEMCFHRDTARGFGSTSARDTLQAKAPTEGTENTYRDLKNSQEALMQSDPCTCRIQTVRRCEVVRICGTGNWRRNWWTTVDCGARMSVSGS